MDFAGIESLIAENPKHSEINFGNPSTAPSEERIRTTEQNLGIALPESYKWFLRNYTGGEVNGDEIYSIYSIDDEEMPGGNLIYQYRLNQRSGYIESHDIPLMSTDFGEFFFFDASSKHEGNEYPVYIKRGEDKQLFAENFLEFLAKVINQEFG